MSQKSGLFLLSLTALVAGVYLSVFGFNLPGSKRSIDPSSIEGFFWPQQKQLADFELVNQDEEKYNLEQLKGKWNFLFFGYTHCPDICPITMNIMRETREKLISQNANFEDQLGFVFISVDGERDHPAHLKSYLGFFGDYFEGATGTTEQVDSLTTQLGVPYSIDKQNPEDKDYLVGHSGAVFLISPQGSLASIYQPPLSAESMAERFSTIMDFLETQS